VNSSDNNHIHTVRHEYQQIHMYTK